MNASDAGRALLKYLEGPAAKSAFSAAGIASRLQYPSVRGSQSESAGT